MKSTKIIFEEIESGEKATMDVTYNSDTNELSVKLEFTPVISDKPKSLYANLAMMLLNQIEQL